MPGPDRHQFVGRREELEAYERAVTDARHGLPSVLLIGGEAGMGKSRLASEGAARSGISLYLGRSAPLGRESIPLAPLADLLRQLRRSRADILGGTERFAALGHWLAPGAHGGVDAVGGPASLFLPVLDLIGALAADDGAVVGFEDLHWADTVTWDLFEFLARNLVDERVVLVGTYRADDVRTDTAQRRHLGDLSRLPATRRIHLEGLGRDGVAARLADLLGEPPEVAFVDEILERGHGNPFFTEELVAAHLAGEAIPAGLTDLIASDIADVDDGTRQVLGAVATIGRGADHALLTTVLDLADDEVEAAVRVAIDARVLVVDPATDTYRFRHPLIGEVVYADLLPPERARLHRRIADALQRQSAARLTRADRAGELAFHLDHAGDREAAFVALLAAVDAAEAVAPAAALRHLERALELWDAVDATAAGARRSDRMWQAAELASGSVGHERAAQLARAAFALGPPPRGAPFGHERLGRYLWSSGRLEESRVEFEMAAALLPADPGPEAALVFAGLGQAELMSGRDESAVRWCTKVFDLLPEPEADREAWLMARRVLGVARSNLGDPEAGVELCRDAAARATTAHAKGLAETYLAVVLLDAGRNQEAVNTALDAVAGVQLAGLDRSFGGYLDALAAEGLVRLGRWAEADTVLARHTDHDPFSPGVLRVACVRARLAARRGAADAARAHLATAHAQRSNGLHQTRLDAVSAEVQLALGDWAAAAVAAERGSSSIPVSAVLWSARFAMLSVEAAVELALLARARLEPIDVHATVAQLRQRLDRVRTTGPLAVDTAAQLTQAAASLTRLGDPDPEAWAEAGRRWGELGDMWSVAAARLREAEASVTARDAARAAEALREAHTIASALGAAPLLAEVEAVSRRTRLSVDLPAPVVLDAPSVDRLGLTPREAEVLTLVAAGHTNRQIGAQLYVSEKTAGVHVSNILRKLGVSSRVDAAAVAQRLGVG